ncbi:hypothetical protein VE04_00766 [Pseudogymnoascus sp. 24MN13]|nr:hypothetical protein VE04_00766 [Pseudogymnoascus sp. 24MN13]
MPASGITGSVLRRSLRAYQIYGANTGVGKTVMSTILCGALHHAFPQEPVWYLKPVSAGPLDDAERHTLSQRVAEHEDKDIISPLSDSSIREKIQAHVTSCSQDGKGTLLVETAGGVHSPTPSGSSQADLYRPLRLPVLLVGDHRLGGISSSISAFESLHIRGYDLNSVLLFEDEQYQNHEYLRDYFGARGVSVLTLPPPPPQESSKETDQARMADYYLEMSERKSVIDMATSLSTSHTSRLDRLDSMADKAHKHIWYPFTQHRGITPDKLMTVDSAPGDFFQTGLGHGNPALSLAAANAAGRCGHLMFASAIHEPALALAELLLENLQNPRMQRVFYSDNGSTGVEVAVKMALTAASVRYGYEDSQEVGVIGLKGSYHGDTIGAMDCSEPSTYNERVHWYRGRGHWFDFPQVKMKEGEWVVEPPEGGEGEFGPAMRFKSLDEVFDMEARDESLAAETYKKHILETLDRLVRVEGKTFGALVMEPIMLGAGGMLLVDPLFQRTLINTIRDSHSLFSASPAPTDPNNWTGLPILFDEVFTGITRLGPFSPSTLLGTQPDISVHAKLLTGGLVPLAATVASEAIYDVFLGDEKRDALLHGHSYTAHAVGCAVAEASVKELLRIEGGEEWEAFRAPWGKTKVDSASGGKDGVWSMWSPTFLDSVSRRTEVESVVALGSVLAIKLRDENPGYTSTAAIGLQSALSRVEGGFGIHSRVLGNVFYVMASQTTTVDVVRGIEERVIQAL